MVFQCINIRQVPWEVLKTAVSGLGFQHLPQDLANINAWKNMFDTYIVLVVIRSPYVVRLWSSELINTDDKIDFKTSPGDLVLINATNAGRVGHNS